MNKPSTGNDLCPLLEKFRDENALTWLETATKLGISETYLHRVRKGKQTFSRKLVNKLNDLIKNPSTTNAREVAAVGSPTGNHVAWLEDQLSYARTKEDRLLKIIEALAAKAQDHSYDASGPPAVAASGARYSTSENKTNKKGA